MAKKTPRKFRQARAAAKPAAKAAFPGKVKAVRKDPTVKYSADDLKALREVAKEAKGGYITTDKGEKVFTKPTETARERIARERAEAMRKYREQIAAEDGPKPKPAKKLGATKAATTATEKPAAKKAAVKKAAPKKEAAAKTTRSAKSAANKAAWKNMTAEERKNWKTTKPGAKPAAPKAEVFSITDVQPEKASKGAKKAKFVQKKTKASVAKTTTAKPSTGGTVAIRPKGTVATTSKTGKAVATTGGGKTTAAAGAVKKGSKLTKFAKKFGKASVVTALAAEAVSAAKGSSEKDFKEIQRLENKLRGLKGQKPKYVNMGSNKNVGESMKADAANLLSLATWGAVGKTRRERMDELNRMIAKQQKKVTAGTGKTDYSVRGRGPGGPGSPAAKAAAANAPSGAKPSTGAGGSTTVTPGGTYVVKKGDTLSGIAKAAGVSLAEIRAANKKFAKNPKYKQGSMIWSGTTVKIPKKK